MTEPTGRGPETRGSSLLAYALKRIVVTIPLAWGIASLVFLLTLLVPGEAMPELSGDRSDPSAVQRLRELHGTDRPVSERYVEWLTGSLRGDLGLSTRFRQPVAELLADALRNTVVLVALAISLQFVLGIVVGVVAVRWEGRWLDHWVTTTAGVIYSLPTYCIGLGLVGVFAVHLGWLPVSQMRSIDASGFSTVGRLGDTLRHLVLPCAALALPSMAGIALYVREQLRAVLTRRLRASGRARGLSETGVVVRLGLRNALVPVVQLFGLALPGIVGGSVVVEVLFSWPGMGRLSHQAVLSRDEPLLLGCTLATSLAVMLGSLLADLLAASADPRLREALR